MKYLSQIFIAMCSTIVVSCTSSNSIKELSSDSVTLETSALKSNLKELALKGYIYGHHDDPVYGHAWKFEEGRSDVKEVCGDYPGLMTFDLGHLELEDSVNLDGVPFDLIREESVKQFERGGIISYSWHLDNPKTGGDSWDVSDSTVVASILEGGENHEKFMSWLDLLSSFLNSIQTADGVKVPIIFRPWHEHTGSWFWWGEKLCSVDEYKALWVMTLDRLKSNGVNNLLFAYSPGSESNGNADLYLERYPGDEYIDVLGLDCYCYGDPEDPNTLTNYREKLQTNLKTVCEIAASKGKIAALTETGYESIPAANWWTEAFEAVCDQFPISYAQTWRNAHDKPNHFYGPYAGHLSADDFVKFYNSPKSLFVKDLEDLYKE